MGFLEAASITVPDAAGETYVVISMQPLSDIRNGRATVWRHFPMCGLTVKLRGRPEAPDQAPRAHNLFRARGADTQTVHGPLQRLLGGGEDGSTYWLRQGDLHKGILRVEVIFA